MIGISVRSVYRLFNQPDGIAAMRAGPGAKLWRTEQEIVDDYIARQLGKPLHYRVIKPVPKGTLRRIA